uniref:RNA-directed DNA polymerase, eukaryota n=1 Tax=Tanacetum cinerariifolium TaxID=118510 RepID=A0A699JA16_TANCI|nr:RNA-directed DNA polymerase, eukaryota [Tanacetum cinerariifolium]
MQGASKIIGVDINENKAAKGKVFRMTDFINPKDHPNKSVSDLVKDITYGFSVDYSFECTGVPSLSNEAIEASKIVPGEVVIMVDFNEFRFKSERFGLVFNVQGANVFNAFIANAGLEEVPLGGSSFTWCHKSATKMSKLDRESQHGYRPTPFGCFNHWLELDGFNKFVTDMWNLAPIDESNAMRNVMIKLKFLKRKIREWLNDNRNKSKSVSDQFKEELQKLDVDIDKRIRYTNIVNKRLEVLNSIQHLDKIKAMDVAQKVKIKWAIEGDENTRFDKPTDNRVHIDMNFPKSITIDQQMDLECAVSKEELKRAMWECGTDKSPRPDGFSFSPYRQFWSSIENDVFAVVSHFFTFGDIPNGCNSCFIAFIPKVPDANLVKDFRPISLIGSMYKIIAKILANRLVGVLGDIVNESLHLSFQRVVDVGMFKGINLSLLVNLSHMFYADDAVFVGQWCDGNINTLVHVLECFFQASGLPINMCKSTKVGGNMSLVQAWTEVVDKDRCLYFICPFLESP